MPSGDVFTFKILFSDIHYICFFTFDPRFFLFLIHATTIKINENDTKYNISIKRGFKNDFPDSASFAAISSKKGTPPRSL